MKRQITKKEEEVIRKCHQDFMGLTTKEAAKQLNKSQRRVQQLLQDVKSKIPQFFPILTKHQRQVRDFINENGFTYQEIAEKLGISKRTVANIVEILKQKKVYLEKRKPNRRYENWMDKSVIQKF